MNIVFFRPSEIVLLPEDKRAETITNINMFCIEANCAFVSIDNWSNLDEFYKNVNTLKELGLNENVIFSAIPKDHNYYDGIMEWLSTHQKDLVNFSILLWDNVLSKNIIFKKKTILVRTGNPFSADVSQNLLKNLLS